MRRTLFWQIFLLTILTMVFGSWNLKESNCTNSLYILKQSQKIYDEYNHWRKAELKIHIQEPRVGTPERYTKLLIDNSSDYFEMERNREEGMLKMIVTENEEGKIFLNGKSAFPEDFKEKYGHPERIKRSKNFYQIMYGLPMSLTDAFWKEIAPAQKATFEGKEVYRVNMELKEELISKQWTLIISALNYKILAIEFNHPEAPEKNEEIIKFYGEYEIDGIKIPRVRDWYDKNTNEYLGTDIIVKQLD